MLGILLALAGTYILVRGFSVTRENASVDLGPVDASITERRAVPLWVPTNVFGRDLQHRAADAVRRSGEESIIVRASLSLVSLRRALFGVGLASVVLGVATPRAIVAQPSLVVLVRHGEKQPTPADDPSLSEAGVARARALDLALAAANPSTIIVSPRKRTSETAAVVQQRVGVAPTVIPLDAQHVKNVAAAVMKASGVVLVVGHSNTIPAIVNALAGTTFPDICDASYATMFLVTPVAGVPGRRGQVVKTTYGTPDAVGADGCAGTMK